MPCSNFALHILAFSGEGSRRNKLPIAGGSGSSGVSARPMTLTVDGGGRSSGVVATNHGQSRNQVARSGIPSAAAKEEYVRGGGGREYRHFACPQVFCPQMEREGGRDERSSPGSGGGRGSLHSSPIIRDLSSQSPDNVIARGGGGGGGSGGGSGNSASYAHVLHVLFLHW